MDVEHTMGPGLAAQSSAKILLNGHSPDFFIEYLTQNVIFHVKIQVTKHVF